MKPTPIIYAEDDQDDAFFMHRAFQQAGVPNPLIILSDGQQVIDYFEGRGDYANRQKYPLPCVLLLDLKLPRKTGFEVLGWMLDSRIQGINVIVVSSSGQALDIDLAKKMGAVDYIIKPSSPVKLTSIVQQFKREWLDAQPIS